MLPRKTKMVIPLAYKPKTTLIFAGMVDGNPTRYIWQFTMMLAAFNPIIDAAVTTIFVTGYKEAVETIILRRSPTHAQDQVRPQMPTCLVVAGDNMGPPIRKQATAERFSKIQN